VWKRLQRARERFSRALEQRTDDDPAPPLAAVPTLKDARAVGGLVHRLVCRARRRAHSGSTPPASVLGSDVQGAVLRSSCTGPCGCSLPDAVLRVTSVVPYSGFLASGPLSPSTRTRCTLMRVRAGLRPQVDGSDLLAPYLRVGTT
jgi:hypothetical protein